VTQEINPDAPYWLHQGIATHESGWLSAERLGSTIDRWRGDLRSDTILSLKAKYDLFRFQGGYELSYTLVDFILLEFGKTALLSFLRHPQDYEGTFSCQPTEFWSRWINFVQTHYLTRTGDIE